MKFEGDEELMLMEEYWIEDHSRRVDGCFEKLYLEFFLVKKIMNESRCDFFE